jgi:hypothetical protein
VSMKEASNTSAWLGAKTKAASRSSLKATSSGLVWIGEKSRGAAVIAGEQARRGAAGAKRTSLATKDWVASTIARRRSAEPSSELPPEPSHSAEPKAEVGNVGLQDSEVPESTPPTSARRSRAKPRAVRASRRELRQSPRVSGRRPVPS